MTILVTGSAGFIGAATVQKLLARGDKVVGIDNHNNYYDPFLKESRLEIFKNNPNYIHLRDDITNKASIEKIFQDYKPKRVIHLAAQAGVRDSLEFPLKYIDSNLAGFINILEACVSFKIEHLVYASSSSVYGKNAKLPYHEDDTTDHSVSLYGASKKANEVIAHSYSSNYNLSTTGLRFFTVYGPWGRPDMACFKFVENIINDRSIDVYNHGNHSRDFTYIDDITDGIIKVLDKPTQINLDWDSKNPLLSSSSVPWKIYNIGNGQPVELMNYIKEIEFILNKKAKINFMPKQKGDVDDTLADISKIKKDFNFVPKIKIHFGISEFIKWYIKFYKS